MANLFLATYGTTMHTYILHMYTIEHMHTAHCTLVFTTTHTCIQTRIHTPQNTHMLVFHHTRFMSLWCYIKET